MINNEIKLFVTFLKRKNKYDEFRFYANSKKHIGSCSRQNYLTFEHYIKSTNASNFLQYAFYWASTTEGDSFWRRLNDEYRIKLYNLRTNNG